jgi:hypothetical protein
MRDTIEAAGGRRFLLSFFSLWVTSGLLMGGYLSDSIFRDIILGTVAAYIAGNTVQKIKTGEKAE